jgi:hypothetical protein
VRQRVTSGTSDRSRREPEPGRSDRAADDARSPRHRRRVWAAMVAAAALVALAGAARNLPLVSTHPFVSKPKTVAGGKAKTAAREAVKPQSPSPHRVVGKSLRSQRAEEAADDAASKATGGKTAKTKPVAHRTTNRSAAPPVHADAQQPTYVSNDATGSASTVAAPPSGGSPAAIPHDSGPAPLQAPAVSPPKPLRSP